MPAVLQHPLELLAAPCARAIILAASFSASTAQLSTQASLVLNDGRDMARCAARALYHLAARCGFSCGQSCCKHCLHMGMTGRAAARIEAMCYSTSPFNFPVFLRCP